MPAALEAQVERRLLRSERTRRELAESLVLASAYRSDEMLDQRWNMAAPMPPARSPLALAPGRRSLTV